MHATFMKPQQSREWIAISTKKFLVPFVTPPPSHPSIDDMLSAVMKHCEFPRVVDKHGNMLLTCSLSLTHHYYFQVNLGFRVHNSWSLLLFLSWSLLLSSSLDLNLQFSHLSHQSARITVCTTKSNKYPPFYDWKLFHSIAIPQVIHLLIDEHLCWFWFEAITSKIDWAEEVAQQLRQLATLAEDRGSFSSQHVCSD